MYFATRHHYMMVQHLYVLSAIACVHFGPELAWCELRGGPTQGTFAVGVPMGRLLFAWGDDGLWTAAARRDSLSDPPLGLEIALPGPLQGLMAAAMDTGHRVTGLLYLTPDGRRQAFGDARGLVLGEEARGEVRRPYGGPQGLEALSIAQEWLAGEYGGLPSGFEHEVTAKEARTPLGLPYSGRSTPVKASNVEAAVTRLRRIGVVWADWRCALAEAGEEPCPAPLTPTATSSACSSTPALPSTPPRPIPACLPSATSSPAWPESTATKLWPRASRTRRSADRSVGLPFAAHIGFFF